MLTVPRHQSTIIAMDHSEILPNLLVGSCPRNPEDFDRLRREAGVSAVLSLQTDEDFAYWDIDWPRMEAHYREDSVEVRLPLGLLLQDWHDNLNQRPRIRRALDGQATAKESHPLSNTLQTEVPVFNRLRVEPDTPVSHFQANVLVLLGQGDRHLLALAVFAGIGQCLLHDPIKGVLQDRGQSLELHIAIEPDRRACFVSTDLAQESGRAKQRSPRW
jgi:hypothetical protein